MTTRFLYLHGFASGPSSRKARFFQERFAARGLTLEIPDLSEGDFENLTVTSQLRLMERALEGHPAVLIGSSLGGYLAALYAARHAETERLLLLAPAFGFAERWPLQLGPEVMEQWRRDGSRPVYHYAHGREEAIGYGLIEDGQQYETNPVVRVPTLICHGRLDEVVPPWLSEEFVHQTPSAELALFDTGHEMTDVLDAIWARSEPFLFPSNRGE